MNLFDRINDLIHADDPPTLVPHQCAEPFWKSQYQQCAEEARGLRASCARAENELAAANKQIAFLERVIDRQRGPARVQLMGVPKRANGPMTQRLVRVSREEAALLVPGVKHDTTDYAGDFDWGADMVDVCVLDDGRDA